LTKFRRKALLALILACLTLLLSVAASPAQTPARLFRVNPQAEGIFLQLSGNPDIKFDRLDNPPRIIIDLIGLEVPPELRNTVIPYNRLGVIQIRIGQHEPTVGRVVLDLNANDPLSNASWQVYSAGSSTVLLKPVANPPPTSAPTVPVSKAMVQGITISATGQLAIQLDRPASYRLLLQGNTYILDIGSAAIAEEFVRPTLTYDSPIQRIRLDEFGDVVRITIQLDDHWQLREGARVSHQINLQLFPPDTATVPPIPVIPHRGKGLVVIDPGHGGRDPGAVDNGVQEKDLVLPISLRLGRLLQSMGYTVQYTRTTDVELELEPRVLFANRLQADVFISIHANSLASRNSSISGVETYYALGSTWGFTLATLVHQQVLLATGARDRGVRAARFYVVRHTTMPAILLETGFVTNPTEAANLSNPSYQERMARGVAQGIDQFFRTYQPIGRRN